MVLYLPIRQFRENTVVLSEEFSLTAIVNFREIVLNGHSAQSCSGWEQHPLLTVSSLQAPFGSFRLLFTSRKHAGLNDSQSRTESVMFLLITIVNTTIRPISVTLNLDTKVAKNVGSSTHLTIALLEDNQCEMFDRWWQYWVSESDQR